MPNLCAVEGCSNGRLKTRDRSGNSSFHLLPSDEALQSLWLNSLVLRRGLGDGVRICSLHFRSGDFEQNLQVSRSLGVGAKRPRLRKDAIPSVAPRDESPPSPPKR
ncbi:hypothetical protein ISCGN_006347, partial [Ixodes scapularis]